MRVVVQRVSRAAVTIDDRIVASIDRGLLVLVGFTPGDTAAAVEWMAEKLVGRLATRRRPSNGWPKSSLDSGFSKMTQTR